MPTFPTLSITGKLECHLMEQQASFIAATIVPNLTVCSFVETYHRLYFIFIFVQEGLSTKYAYQLKVYILSPKVSRSLCVLTFEFFHLEMNLNSSNYPKAKMATSMTLHTSSNGSQVGKAENYKKSAPQVLLTLD